MKNTTHRIHFTDASDLNFIPAESVALTVTSPPYPMIKMWDEIFARQNPNIKTLINQGNGKQAFELMHQVLLNVWKEVYRVLMPGGIACINIGDATRTVDGIFQLFSNHARILNDCLSIGFVNLPQIYWRKPTNAPNKFMGSGMLPAGAYVTLENEHILILRKGDKRVFSTEEEKQNRRGSAFFWEERNRWFSDVWELRGEKQPLNGNSRDRSGAFPFEIPYRLVNMFSVKGDTVLDPFAGIGTVNLACIASERNSIGVEIDAGLKDIVAEKLSYNMDEINRYVRKRLFDHSLFIQSRFESGKEIKHFNDYHRFPVITAQEKDLVLNEIGTVVSLSEFGNLEFHASYQPISLEIEEVIGFESFVKKEKYTGNLF